MRHDHDIITREEMIELTGTPLKSKQCDALREPGYSLWKERTATLKQHGGIL